MEVAVHPEFAAHGSYEHLLLGRSEVSADSRMLRLTKYDVGLPDAPPSLDLFSKVDAWPMYGNDRLGDCTCAAAGHMVEAWSAAAGTQKTPLDADVEAAYIPGTGTDDTGRVEIDVLNYWRKTGIGGDTIHGYVSANVKHAPQLKSAAYVFGGLYIGAALPLTAQGQAIWDVVPDAGSRAEPGSWGGHAIPVVGYDADHVVVVTWGAVLKMTWAFWNAYVDEAYAVVSPDYFAATGETPAGFDLATLDADLDALG